MAASHASDQVADLASQQQRDERPIGGNLA
jgi:hypothetical protein